MVASLQVAVLGQAEPVQRVGLLQLRGLGQIGVRLEASLVLYQDQAVEIRRCAVLPAAVQHFPEQRLGALTVPLLVQHLALQGFELQENRRVLRRRQGLRPGEHEGQLVVNLGLEQQARRLEVQPQGLLRAPETLEAAGQVLPVQGIAGVQAHGGPAGSLGALPVAQVVLAAAQQVVEKRVLPQLRPFRQNPADVFSGGHVVVGEKQGVGPGEHGPGVAGLEAQAAVQAGHRFPVQAGLQVGLPHQQVVLGHGRLLGQGAAQLGESLDGLAPGKEAAGQGNAQLGSSGHDVHPPVVLFLNLHGSRLHADFVEVEAPLSALVVVLGSEAESALRNRVVGDFGDPLVVDEEGEPLPPGEHPKLAATPRGQSSRGPLDQVERRTVEDNIQAEMSPVGQEKVVEVLVVDLAEHEACRAVPIVGVQGNPSFEDEVPVLVRCRDPGEHPGFRDLELQAPAPHSGGVVFGRFGGEPVVPKAPEA